MFYSFFSSQVGFKKSQDRPFTREIESNKSWLVSIFSIKCVVCYMLIINKNNKIKLYHVLCWLLLRKYHWNVEKYHCLHQSAKWNDNEAVVSVFSVSPNAEWQGGSARPFFLPRHAVFIYRHALITCRPAVPFLKLLATAVSGNTQTHFDTS